MSNGISNLDAYYQSSINKKFLSPVRLPRGVIIYYSFLMIYFPFSDKKKIQYNKLKYNQKAGFLFHYMLKCAYQARVPESLIDDLISTKKSYDFIQKVYNNKNLDDNDFLLDKIKKSTLNDMKEDIEILLEKNKLKEIFENKIKLMADLIYYIMSNENERKRKIEEIFEIDK
jgi:hypothetical protein